MDEKSSESSSLTDQDQGLSNVTVNSISQPQPKQITVFDVATSLEKMLKDLSEKVETSDKEITNQIELISDKVKKLESKVIGSA